MRARARQGPGLARRCAAAARRRNKRHPPLRQPPAPHLAAVGQRKGDAGAGGAHQAALQHQRQVCKGGGRTRHGRLSSSGAAACSAGLPPAAGRRPPASGRLAGGWVHSQAASVAVRPTWSASQSSLSSQSGSEPPRACTGGGRAARRTDGSAGGPAQQLAGARSGNGGGQAEGGKEQQGAEGKGSGAHLGPGGEEAHYVPPAHTLARQERHHGLCRGKSGARGVVGGSVRGSSRAAAHQQQPSSAARRRHVLSRASSGQLTEAGQHGGRGVAVLCRQAIGNLLAAQAHRLRGAWHERGAYREGTAQCGRVLPPFVQHPLLLLAAPRQHTSAPVQQPFLLPPCPRTSRYSKSGSSAASTSTCSSPGKLSSSCARRARSSPSTCSASSCARLWAEAGGSGGAWHDRVGAQSSTHTTTCIGRSRASCGMLSVSTTATPRPGTHPCLAGSRASTQGQALASACSPSAPTSCARGGWVEAGGAVSLRLSGGAPRGAAVGGAGSPLHLGSQRPAGSHTWANIRAGQAAHLVQQVRHSNDALQARLRVRRLLQRHIGHRLGPRERTPLLHQAIQAVE